MRTHTHLASNAIPRWRVGPVRAGGRRAGGSRADRRLGALPRMLRLTRVLGLSLMAAVVVVAVTAMPASALPVGVIAQGGWSAWAAVADLPTVVANATRWLVGFLAALATFFLTLGGVRYLLAGGDPGEVERAKGALRSAAFGYALALLAPVILRVLQSILGV